jgi:hypothetical protein
MTAPPASPKAGIGIGFPSMDPNVYPFLAFPAEKKGHTQPRQLCVAAPPLGLR